MENLRNTVRPIALTIFAPTAGFLFILLLEVSLDIELSKLLSSLVNLVVVALIAFLIFPKRLGIPFGRIDTREFLRRVGLYLPDGAWKHAVLGLSLAGCTLSGMLLASVLTGSYVMDTGARATFHYFHDALLKFVQIPATVDPGATHRALFYVILWVMVGIGCVITRLVVEKFGVRAPAELYHLEGG